MITEMSRTIVRYEARMIPSTIDCRVALRRKSDSFQRGREGAKLEEPSRCNTEDASGSQMSIAEVASVSQEQEEIRHDNPPSHHRDLRPAAETRRRPAQLRQARH